VWLAFVLMLMIFHNPKAKTFCLASFLAKKKKDGCEVASNFLFLARKIAKLNFFA
jgi:hypothetical protein